MMKKGILLLLLMVYGLSIQAQIYKWTDSRGNVHFSDEPHPGAEKIDLPEAQTFSSPPEAPARAASIPEPIEADEKQTEYNLSITEPTDQATIRNNQGFVSVMVELEPSLRDGDKLQMIFDGKALGKPIATTVFALNDINRGAHTIATQVVDSDGKVLKTSEPITIYMHRPRTGMVPQTPPPRGRP